MGISDCARLFSSDATTKTLKICSQTNNGNRGTLGNGMAHGRSIGRSIGRISDCARLFSSDATTKTLKICSQTPFGDELVWGRRTAAQQHTPFISAASRASQNMLELQNAP